jgi:hypothetical protein
MRIVGECTDVDERDAVGIRLEPAAAIDENREGTRGSNPIAPAQGRCRGCTWRQPTDVSWEGRRSMRAPFSLPALTSAGFADAALRQIKGAEVANGGGVGISAHRVAERFSERNPNAGCSIINGHPGGR